MLWKNRAVHSSHLHDGGAVGDETVDKEARLVRTMGTRLVGNGEQPICSSLCCGVSLNGLLASFVLRNDRLCLWQAH